MIYKFKSQADADVIMLEPNGDQMLMIMGREPSAQGIVTVTQIPAALAALEAAILALEAAETRATEHPDQALPNGGDSVRLRARAGPFMALMRQSERLGKDVVWGV